MKIASDEDVRAVMTFPDAVAAMSAAFPEPTAASVAA